MTVTVDDLTETVFVGAGSASPLAIAWRFLDGDDLVVTKIVAGVEDPTALVRGIDYSVSGGGLSGGTVTPLAAIPVGTSWRVRRGTGVGQPSSFPSGNYSASQHETAHDRLALIVQELKRELSRTLKNARGELGYELPLISSMLGKFLAVDATGNVVPSDGTGADAGLRTDLAATGGAALVGTAPFSGSTIPDAAGVQAALQALETLLETVDGDVDTLRDAGDAGLAALAAFGTDEARSAIGLVEARKGNLTANGTSHVVNSNDFMPAVHYAGLGAAGEVYFDVSGLRYYQPYLFVNGSAFDGDMVLDCGADTHFRAPFISPSDATKTTITIKASSWAILVKYGGNRIQVITPVRQGDWITGSNCQYRYMADGKIELIYTRPVASTISATSESTANTIPSTLSLANAQVIGQSPVPTGTGAPTGTLIVPFVSRMGTAGSLANNYTFGIYNPNAATWSRGLTIHFIGVEEA